VETVTPFRIAIVDDHALLAQSVVLTLRTHGFDAVAFDHRDERLFEQLTDGTIDLVLMDLMLGSAQKAGLVMTQRLTNAGRTVIVVTATTDELLHAECLEAGALGVINKADPIDVLVAAVQRVVRGESITSQSELARALSQLGAHRRSTGPVEPTPASRLTEKERLILSKLVDGHAAGRIARDMNISILTVRTHIRSILMKLQVHTQIEAITMALKGGWDLS
jgi:two-component system, NarL family, nitrate/nitrite response regulator NarL